MTRKDVTQRFGETRSPKFKSKIQVWKERRVQSILFAFFWCFAVYVLLTSSLKLTIDLDHSLFLVQNGRVIRGMSNASISSCMTKSWAEKDQLPLIWYWMTRKLDVFQLWCIFSTKSPENHEIRGTIRRWYFTSQWSLRTVAYERRVGKVFRDP